MGRVTGGISVVWRMWGQKAHKSGERERLGKTLNFLYTTRQDMI